MAAVHRIALQGRVDRFYVCHSSQSFLAPAIATDDNFATLAEYKPETGRQYELGVKYDNGGFSTNLALFDIRKANVDQKDQTAMTRRLAGEVTLRGVEWSATGDLGQGWSLSGNYAYTDAYYRQDADYQGNTLPNVPKHAGSAYLTWGDIALAGGTMRIGTGLRYVGRRYIEQNNRLTVPDYTIADAFISWTGHIFFGSETTIQLNAGNLTDKACIVSIGNQARRLTWGEGRTFRLTARTSL